MQRAIVSTFISEPRRRFKEAVDRPDHQVNLAGAALLVACEEYPQLPVERYLARLDALAEEVKDRLSDESAPLLVFEELIETLFVRNGFRGNRDAYYDPRNSFLNDVLDRRKGIPLTLGIILLEVGWRLGLPLSGVNFPGHFLVRFEGEAVRFLADPFDGGRLRFEDEAQELLDRVYGGMVRVRPAFLRTAGRRDMLVRLLTNLKGVYRNVDDHERALAAIERILVIHPTAPTEIRDRGTLLARMGRTDEALAQLEWYLDYAPEAADAERIRSLVDDLKEEDTP
jgi:regulator of sirC expression with transglutaminase-like and TPR domain